MNLDNSLLLQNQIRQNSEELQDYLKDLENWEEDMKKKEQELKLVQVMDDEVVPPVRNVKTKTSRKSKNRKNRSKPSSPVKSRISSFDYNAWEKFDVDSELKKVDDEKKESSASESDKEEELDRQRNKQLAIVKKDKGNDYFKKGAYDSAINSYTIGMGLDPENPLLPANRAMAFLKKEQYQAAENDCCLCISLDSTYTKAYLRRGAARKALNKLELAKEDFLKALELEPDNKQAAAELEKINEEYHKNIQVPSPDLNLLPEQLLKEAKSVPKPLEAEKPTSKFSDAKEEKEKGAEKKEKEKSAVKLKKSTTAALDENIFDDIKHIISKIEQTLPPVPSTSYQFYTDWKVIAKSPELKYKYLKQFPADSIPTVFKHSIEADLFPQILNVLSTSFIENGDDVFPYFKNLPLVGRFNTIMLFVSDAEKQDIRKLANYISMSGYLESEINQVLKSYGMC